jgi:hypothetical protein
MFYLSSSSVVVWESAVTKNNSREKTQFGTHNFASIYSMFRKFSVRGTYGRGSELASGLRVFCDVNRIAREFFG